MAQKPINFSGRRGTGDNWVPNLSTYPWIVPWTQPQGAVWQVFFGNTATVTMEMPVNFRSKHLFIRCSDGATGQDGSFTLSRFTHNNCNLITDNGVVPSLYFSDIYDVDIPGVVPATPGNSWINCNPLSFVRDFRVGDALSIEIRLNTVLFNPGNFNAWFVSDMSERISAS